MERIKDVHSKKSLVRNSEKPLPKCKVRTTSDSQKNALKENATRGFPTKSSEISRESRNKFDSPELYSSLKLSKHIDKIVKPRKTKSCSDVVTKQLAVDEKISRKVNFPYSQSIYKGLISLTCNQIPQQTVVAASRDPFSQKDKEPLLSEFAISKSSPKYYSVPNVNLEIKPLLIASNNLKLYNHLYING